MKPDNKKLTLQSLLSKLTLVLGLLLMVFTIYSESEPGAIPLLLIVVGTCLIFRYTRSTAIAEPYGINIYTNTLG